ncbi:MAG: ImmA/IrrE family metallo-endopeptidase, partial [candidate division WOR-3 bacterium]
ELARFARLYGRTLDFFLAAEAPSPEPVVRWRSRGERAARLRAERRFVRFCEDYARLEKFARVKPGALPSVCATRPVDWAGVERLAEETRKVMELGSQPAPALCSVLEDRHGVKVLIVDTQGGGSSACTKGDFGFGILVNAADAPWRRNFDIAHELYHLLTWDEPLPQPGEATDKPLDEKFADCFASVLLLPSDPVRDECRRRIHDDRLTHADVVAIARGFGVSTEALLWRLKSLRVIPRSAVEQALTDDNLKQADRDERREDHDRQQVRPSVRFVSLAFECLQNGTLSRGAFAQMMGIRRGRVGEFLAEYGLDETGDFSGQVGAA